MATKTTRVKAPAAAPPALAEDAAAADASPEDGVAITWHGRTMRVHRPTAGMIGVWQLTLNQINRGNGGSEMTPAQTTQIAGRMIKVTTSVLEDPADRLWVEDLLLDQEVTLEEAAEEILKATTTAYRDLGNRAEKRVLAKATRATLR